MNNEELEKRFTQMEEYIDSLREEIRLLEDRMVVLVNRHRHELREECLGFC